MVIFSSVCSSEHGTKLANYVMKQFCLSWRYALVSKSDFYTASMRKPSVNRRNTEIKELIFCSQLLCTNNHFKLNPLWGYTDNKYLVLFEQCFVSLTFLNRSQYFPCKSIYKCIFTDGSIKISDYKYWK